MLELLAKYAGTANPGFAAKQVRWAIACDERGRFLDVLELGDTGSKKNRGQIFLVCPEFDRRVKQAGGKSEFLVDTAEVMALYGEAAADEKVKTKHSYFVKLLRNASKSMPELLKVADLLEDSQELAKVRGRFSALRIRPTERVTLMIGDRFPVESSAWHDWWRMTRQSVAAAGVDHKSGKRMLCFITGQVVEPLKTHPKIEGLAGVGGLSMGDVLVGFDKDAFQSYGLDQSTNAAISEEAASGYRTAFNDLIRNHSQKLSGAKVVYWFKEKVRAEDDPISWLEEPPETEEYNAQQAARDLLGSIETGKRADLGGNYFYGMIVSGASGRVMVRDWMEGQFKELVTNIGCWFDDLSIIHRDGGRPASNPKFMAVMAAVVRDLRYNPPEPPAPFVAKMWRVAVRNEPVPQTALAQAFVRVKVDIIKGEQFNHARMGLMKAYHVRRARAEKKEENMKPYLNEEHPSSAYHCGRMMAVLAKLQQAALGDVGAGVVQRYYAAASATPALVLGRLIRGGQFHLNKLDPGLAHWYEEKLGCISVRLEDKVPKTLTLEEQSLFALGYYQQWVDLRTKKSVDEKKEL